VIFDPANRRSIDDFWRPRLIPSLSPAEPAQSPIAITGMKSPIDHRSEIEDRKESNIPNQ